MAAPTIRKFIKHANDHLKRQEQIDLARRDLKNHFSMIDRLPKSQPLKVAIRDLKKKVDSLSEKERQIIRYEYMHEQSDKELKEKIERLEKKLSEYMNMMDFRSSRIKELENKIMDSISDKEVSHKIDEIHYELGDMKKKVASRSKPKKSSRKVSKKKK